jgi:hypothetical protein
LSAVTQNQPLKVEIKGVKTSHFDPPGLRKLVKQNQSFRPPGLKKLARQNQPFSANPWPQVIMAKVELRLSAQRIYQDLVGENGFTDSYQSVKRFVRKVREVGQRGQSMGQSTI